MKLSFLLSLPFVLLALTGCDKQEKPYVERPVGEIYGKAVSEFKKGELEAAAEEFDEVERQHPYSSWAPKAQLMAAYSYYRASKYDMALATLETFIQIHPGHKDIAYAYYLRALCYYDEISSVKRDQKNTELAKDALEDVIKRFPGTKYARDAQYKHDFILDHLAGKEMEVGRFYLFKKQYIASINRFKEVLEKYQKTTHVPEALHRLVEAYLALGLTEEAQKMGAILGHNYPNNKWYKETYFLLKGVDMREPVSKENNWFRNLFK